MPSREQIETALREAFRGVRLGDGVSLQQAELFDEFTSLSEAELAQIPAREVTDDWAALTWSDLWEAKTAHFDAEGLRYYLPALLLQLLDHYDGSDSWSIGTIGGLDQRDGHPVGFLDLLTAEQRQAIADYLLVLPDVVELDVTDQKIIERAYRDVWSRYQAGSPRGP